MKRVAAILWGVAMLAAHPLGNASVNHYARLEPTADGVNLTYALDLAEVPSFELFQAWGLEPRVSSLAEVRAKGREQARVWVSQLDLVSGGKPAAVRFEGADVDVADGAGSLLVLRITARAQVAALGDLQYEDPNFEGRAGWKEIVVAAGDGATVVESSHTSRDVSKALTAYPDDPLQAPPQDLRASVSWRSKANPPAKAQMPDPAGPTPVEAPPPGPIVAPQSPSMPEERKFSPAAAVVLLILAAALALLWWRGTRRPPNS